MTNASTVTFTPDQIKVIKANTEQMLQYLRSQQASNALGDNWFACSACKVGFNIVAGGAIAAALALGGGAVAASAAVTTAVATFFGITEIAAGAVIGTAVAGGAATVEEIISNICAAMGACSG